MSGTPNYPTPPYSSPLAFAYNQAFTAPNQTQALAQQQDQAQAQVQQQAPGQQQAQAQVQQAPAASVTQSTNQAAPPVQQAPAASVPTTNPENNFKKDLMKNVKAISAKMKLSGKDSVRKIEEDREEKRRNLITGSDKNWEVEGKAIRFDKKISSRRMPNWPAEITVDSAKSMIEDWLEEMTLELDEKDNEAKKIRDSGRKQEELNAIQARRSLLKIKAETLKGMVVAMNTGRTDVAVLTWLQDTSLSQARSLIEEWLEGMNKNLDQEKSEAMKIEDQDEREEDLKEIKARQVRYEREAETLISQISIMEGNGRTDISLEDTTADNRTLFIPETATLNNTTPDHLCQILQPQIIYHYHLLCHHILCKFIRRLRYEWTYVNTGITLFTSSYNYFSYKY